VTLAAFRTGRKAGLHVANDVVDQLMDELAAARADFSKQLVATRAELNQEIDQLKAELAAAHLSCAGSMRSRRFVGWRSMTPSRRPSTEGHFGRVSGFTTVVVKFKNWSRGATGSNSCLGAALRPRPTFMDPPLARRASFAVNRRFLVRFYLSLGHIFLTRLVRCKQQAL
jgi:hypothetical protein